MVMRRQLNVTFIVHCLYFNTLTTLNSLLSGFNVGHTTLLSALMWQDVMKSLRMKVSYSPLYSALFTFRKFSQDENSIQLLHTFEWPHIRKSICDIR